MSESKVAIIGAGNVGGNLGARLSQAGVLVRFGVRDASKAEAALAKSAPGTNAVAPEEAAAWADVIVLAVPGSAAVEAARALGALDGRVLVDCTNPIRWDDGPVWAPPAAGSNAAALANACPGARVVKAFNSFGAELHGDPRLSAGPVDVPMAGDDPDAKRAVAALAERGGFTPIDAGPLRNAALLENLAVLWIHLAMKGGHGREIGFKLLRRG